MSFRPKPVANAPKEQSRLAFVLEAGSRNAAAKNQSAIGMMAREDWPSAWETIRADPELQQWVDDNTKDRGLPASSKATTPP